MQEISNKGGINKMIKVAIKIMDGENSDKEFKKMSLLWEGESRK